MAMPVIAFVPPARSRPMSFPHRVGVVESDQSLASRLVQGQRVPKPVPALRGNFGSHHYELHPVSEFIDEQRLAVKLEKSIKAVVSVSRNRNGLSSSDNSKQVIVGIGNVPMFCGARNCGLLARKAAN